jgi:IS30 family transposase
MATNLTLGEHRRIIELWDKGETIWSIVAYTTRSRSTIKRVIRAEKARRAQK